MNNFATFDEPFFWQEPHCYRHIPEKKSQNDQFKILEGFSGKIIFKQISSWEVWSILQMRDKVTFYREMIYD